MQYCDNTEGSGRSRFLDDPEVRAVMQTLGLPDAVVDRAAAFLTETGTKRIDMVVKIASLYVACINMDIDRTLQEFIVSSRDLTYLTLSRTVRRLWRNAARGNNKVCLYRGTDVKKVIPRFVASKLSGGARRERCAIENRMRALHSSRIRDTVDKVSTLERLFSEATKQINQK